MADDLLEQAASATQGMIPGGGQQGQQGGGMTTFGPTPIVQPPPIPRFQPPPDQSGRQTHFDTVGSRKRADKQALFHGIAGFVKSGSDYIAANKQRALSMDIEKLMEAQQGMQEAQQKLQANPNDPEAKKALETNTSIINVLTKDPKKAKLLQKALNIDLFGDGKNKKENMALIEAWKQYDAKQKAGDKTALNPTAQRMQQQQPNREQLSPEAKQQEAAVKAGLVPKAGEILKANAENFKTLQAAKTGDERAASVEHAAKIRASAERYHADKYLDAMNIRVGGMQYAADVKARSERYKADSVAQSWGKRIDAMTSIASDKNLNEKTKTIFSSMAKDATAYNSQLKVLVEENTKLQTELDKKGTTIIGGIKFDAAKPTDAKLMRQKIGQNNAAMRDAQSNLADVHKQIQTLQQMGIISMAGEDAEETDTGTKDEPLPPPEDDDEN